jgi:hypothetical protein
MLIKRSITSIHITFSESKKEENKNGKPTDDEMD